MGYRSIIITALVLASCVVPARAANLAFPDRGRAAVVDAAHVLPPADAAALNARVAAWDNATGHQLAIATIPSLQGDDIADYGYRLGRAWGLGRKGINDGVLLLIAPAEHKVRIDVGRGLEGDLTDAETSVILHETVVPKLKAGDISGAANAGADAVMAAVPAGAGDVANAPKSSGGNALGIIMTIIGGLVVGALLVWAWRMLRRMKRSAKEERDRFAAMRQRHDDMRQRVEADIGADARPAGPCFDLHAPMGGIPQPLAPRGTRYPVNVVTPAPPRRDTTIIAPVIINQSSYSPPPSYSSDSSSSWGSSDNGSSSSFDSGSSSSGFDSGGGDFGGGGSDSSW